MSADLLPAPTNGVTHHASQALTGLVLFLLLPLMSADPATASASAEEFGSASPLTFALSEGPLDMTVVIRWLGCGLWRVYW